MDKYLERGKLQLIHAWHVDDGFRAAAARNYAVFLSSGDYLVFIDGDCLALPNFIDRQHECAEPGYMVRGSRVMMTEAYTARVLQGETTPVSVAGAPVSWRYRAYHTVDHADPKIPET